jgi:trk system potassium uptake protein TrkH
LPQYPDGVPSDNFTLIVLGSLIGLGALGIPVLSELFSWRLRRRFSLHTRLTLVVVTFLIILGWFGLWIPEANHGVLVDVPFGSQMVRTWFQSVSARTAGFAGLPHFDQLQPESRLILIGLMFIGSSPASMGGGLTTGTFAVLLLALWAHARGNDHVEIDGRRIAVDTVRRAGAVLTVGLFVVLVATWLLLLVQDFTLDQALFEVVSAFSTCGLSLGITGQLNVFSQFIIAFVMFWGRLGALTIVSAIGQQSKRTQLVQYPEETVLIG